MGRWNHLVARLTILGLILALVWMGSKPMIRALVVDQVQRFTGSRFDVERMEPRFSERVLEMAGVAIADPDRPDRNLLQAESARFEFNAAALWHRRFVVERGSMTEVQLDTPRTSSGKLGSNQQIGPQAVAKKTVAASPAPRTQASNLGQRWTDQFSSFVLQESNWSSASMGLVAELEQKWQNQTRQLEREIAGVGSSLEVARQQVEQRPDNPLRDQTQVVEAIETVNGIQSRLAMIQSQLNEFSRQGQTDLRRIILQRENELEQLNSVSTPLTISSELSSQLLLGGKGDEYAQRCLEWVGWFRDVMPEAQDFQPMVTSGKRVLFQGETAKPDFEIRELQIDGKGQFQGQHIEYAGTIRNFSNQPELMDQPLEVFFRAQGRQHFVVQARLDGRRGAELEEYHIVCPDLDLPGETLGDPGNLIVNLGDGRLSGEGTLHVDGGRLSGTFRVEHRGTALHVSHLHELAGGNEIKDLINQQLASVNRFEMQIELSGTLEKPTWQCRTDLGARFDQAVIEAFARREQRYVQTRREKLLSHYQACEAQLQKSLNEQLSELAKKLDGQVSGISELRAQLPQQGENRIR